MTVEVLMFEATAAFLTIEQYQSEPEELTVNLSLNCSAPADLRDANTFNLHHANWVLCIDQRSSVQEDEQEEELASLTYKASSGSDSSKPPFCLIRVQQSATAFDALLNTLRAGRLPTEIFVCVEGMEKKGDWTKWDTASLPKLVVSSTSLEIPLIPSRAPAAAQGE